MVGVLSGMEPDATVDFMRRVIRLTVAVELEPVTDNHFKGMETNARVLLVMYVGVREIGAGITARSKRPFRGADSMAFTGVLWISIVTSGAISPNNAIATESLAL